MTKEWVISIVIVIAIVIGDIFTMKYTNQSVDEATTALAKMREEIAKEDEEINSEQVKTQIGNIRDNWNKRHKKLAIYIEHDELEKIETDLSGYVEKEEYSDAMAQLDMSVYVLEHIKNKTVLSIINIF
mgnify:CR=1 FL=1